MIDHAAQGSRSPRALVHALGALVSILLVASVVRAGYASKPPVPVSPGAADSAGFEADQPDSFAIVSPGWGEGRNWTPLETESPDEGEWLRAPFGENLLTDPDAWSTRESVSRFGPVVDYNRVDQLRLGVRYQAQAPDSYFPRLGARLEYALGRERTLYGVQLEQPLLSQGRLAVGVTAIRATDHSELHQVDDLENSLAMLFGRQDYRDYFEREGFGAYVSSRVRGFSTVSVGAGNYQYRSLPAIPGTRSWFRRDRALRPNPPIDDGESHTWSVRLERLAHRTRLTRAGLYHWIELERAGGGLGGDFDYARLLADVRSVLRLSPAATLSLRLVGGSTPSGSLSPQREFTAGGVDGLRAHAFSEFRGNQLALGQAEYTIGLWRLRSNGFVGGLNAIAFLDAGRAWQNAGHDWNVSDQRIAADGGIGIATSEDNLRLYFAKDLHDPDSSIAISARLRRPF